MKKLLFFFILIACPNFSNAQNDGDIDPTFAIGDSMVKNGVIKATAVQTDGKIIAVGEFTKYNEVEANRIIRFNPDGTRDLTFATGTGFDAIINCIAIQSDGKILIGGAFTTYNGTATNNIVRLNADGSMDISFNPGGAGPNSVVYAIAIQSNGSIVIGGGFGSYNGVNSTRIARLNPDGSLDASLNNMGTGFNGAIYALAIQPNGKIVAGGAFYNFNGSAANNILRINTDGSRDINFTIGNGCNNSVRALKLQADGKIVAGGMFTTYNGIASKYIVRLNTDGIKDTTFSIAAGFNNYVLALDAQNDGKLLVGGIFSQYRNVYQSNLVRLNTDGTTDTSFSIGSGINSTVNSITAQPSGKILTGGEFNFYNGINTSCLIQLNADGAMDTALNLLKFRNYENELLVCMGKQSTGKIITAGNFTSSFGNPCGRITRFNANGTTDTSFTTGSGANSIIRCLAVQSDDKVILGGQFNSFNGIPANGIIRLNADGTTDTSFITGSGFTGVVYSLAIQDDGKILVAGAFGGYNGTAILYLVRLNINGTVDTTFNAGGSGFLASGGLRSVVIQPDGKILVCGVFNRYNTTYISSIMRLNSDGSIDTSFSAFANSEYADIYNSITGTDGKIYIVGWINYNNTNRNGLMKLNNDGSIVTEYNANYGFEDFTFALSLQSDGKLLVGGDFLTFDGLPSKNLIRLNADGSKDDTFDVGGGFNAETTLHSHVTTTMVLDGSILVGGVFTDYKGVAANGIIKLQANNPLNHPSINEERFSLFPNPVKNILNIKANSTDTLQSYEIVNLVGQKVAADTSFNQSIDVSDFKSGMYVLKIKTTNGAQNIKFIKE